MRELLSKAELLDTLRTVGHGRYHYLHPYHLAMNSGGLNQEQIRGWVANRYYYQVTIPRKDGAILSNCPVKSVRRTWIHRIIDHDGFEDNEGGLEAWLRLGTAVGLTPEELEDHRHVLPGVRFAVDAYLNFCKAQPWPAAVASSLTELFAPDLMRDRIEAFRIHYPWVPEWGFDYFKSRVTQARADSNEAVDLTYTYCDTPELQRAAIDALGFKCDLLWSMLDAMALAYGPHLASQGRSGSAQIAFDPPGVA